MTDAGLPGWTGAGGPKDAAWNTVILGDIVLPGICSITSLECGIDVATKKAKGHDCPTSTDNGLKAAQFVIEVWLNERMWPAWVAIASKIHPRRPGRERQPVEIRHPDPNSLGIQHVRILSISTVPPTGRGGKRYRIKVEEWFDEPRAVKKPANGVQVPKRVTARDLQGGLTGTELARKMARDQGYILPPDDPDSIAANLF